MFTVELYARIRRAVMVDGLSRREAARRRCWPAADASRVHVFLIMIAADSHAACRTTLSIA